MTRISRLLGEGLFDRAELAARGEIKNIEREGHVEDGRAARSADSPQAGRSRQHCAGTLPMLPASRWSVS